ncbi:MAG: hypothetical protein MZU91_12615 [Desulfosudis oleivorans]|nr:hypothetical protein [Desulfosudis oleivorans]
MRAQAHRERRRTASWAGSVHSSVALSQVTADHDSAQIFDGVRRKLRVPCPRGPLNWHDHARAATTARTGRLDVHRSSLSRRELRTAASSVPNSNASMRCRSAGVGQPASAGASTDSN